MNIDIVVSEFTYMAQYRDLFPNAFHVLSEHNIESQLVRRQAQIEAPPTALVAQIGLAAATDVGLREADALEQFETQMWPQFPLRYTVSDLDRQQIMARCSVGETIVVNNGADTQALPVLPDRPVPRMLLFGTLKYFPNVDAAFYVVNEILPLVWQVNDQVEFWLAGANPSPELIELVARDPRIKLVANPEDMTDVARECCISVVPLRSGGGTRIKILHALAMGLPTITTSLGCEGLEVEDGQHLLIRDRPEDFAAAIVTLLADADQREILRRSGRNLVAAKYDWQRIFDQAVGLMIDRWQQWRGTSG